MLRRIRERASEEQGFTLVELLVVILIIGILAAIAIPSFLNQRGKANDASAKTAVRTAQTAMESYATDNNGDYTGATDAILQGIEPTLNDDPADSLAVTGADGNGYTVAVDSEPSGRTFTITREGGATTRTCTVPAGEDNGGCQDVTAGAGTW